MGLTSFPDWMKSKTEDIGNRLRDGEDGGEEQGELEPGYDI